ncbi:MAG: sulfite exporter TauE/SafE family protein [Vicinamibacterales bacterium]
MTSPITWLLVGLSLVGSAFVLAWWRSASTGDYRHGRPTPLHLAIGAVTLFFDTLGIGNFAPCTALFRVLTLVRDELIPGTLNVGSAVPQSLEAFVFLAAIAVDPVTVFLLVAVGAVGSFLGGRIVSTWPRRAIQAGMGVALLVGASLMLLTNMGWIPGGGTAIGFSGGLLAAAVALNFVFGGLCALGIGTYAPSLIAFSLLGMDPRAAFPIMAGSAAYMQLLSAIAFVRHGRYDGRAALGLTLGGVPGVLVAAYLVKTLPLVTIRWLVVVAVLYASVSLLRTALASRTPEAAP